MAGVPIQLLPAAVAHQIRKTGIKIYRISIKRGESRLFNVSVRTKSIPRELMPERVAVLDAIPGIVEQAPKPEGGMEWGCPV
jgi:hypothetical protein